MAVVRALIQKSPQRSARKHAAALRLSDRSEENSAPRSVNASLQNSDCTKTEESDFENRAKLCRDLLNVCVTGVFFLVRHISTSLAQ